MKEITEAWIEYARRDFRSAEKNAEDEFLSNIVTFHSHQFVEKLFKALLPENEIYFPKVHDIYKSYSLVPVGIKEKLGLNEEDLLRINEIYIESRYPTEFGILPSGFPKKEQAISIFNISKIIFSRMLEFLEKS
jgi:HEPN domain-containing protein